ncbi:hypothetical protein EJ04DRAFT_567367 [Polyplosphaeria fusca]|uniref:Uncharacterized protein n=1 Tax=Polyplosphaeria fusca TaxID=682080 RepID=A0A9P4QNQ6_9PLEO|nr:hypothetical protein EJ04DRAFT_567367 [Polyplosphaeria fusca]
MVSARRSASARAAASAATTTTNVFPEDTPRAGASRIARQIEAEIATRIGPPRERELSTTIRQAAADVLWQSNVMRSVLRTDAAVWHFMVAMELEGCAEFAKRQGR